jgi:molybdopterin-guanine dinucleotide biosynthesis protein A
VVLAGDMPYVTSQLVDTLVGALPVASTDELIDAVGVRVGGLPEPLVCVLHRRVLPVVERRIAQRRYKASGLLTDEGLRVTWIDWADAAALKNINAPEDLARPPRE